MLITAVDANYLHAGQENPVGKQDLDLLVHLLESLGTPAEPHPSLEKTMETYGLEGKNAQGQPVWTSKTDNFLSTTVPEQIAGGRVFFRLTDDEGNLQALAVMNVYTDGNDGLRKGRIFDLVVAPGQERQGHGTALLEAINAYAMETGIEKLSVFLTPPAQRKEAETKFYSTVLTKLGAAVDQEPKGPNLLFTYTPVRALQSEIPADNILPEEYYGAGQQVPDQAGGWQRRQAGTNAASARNNSELQA